MSEEEQYILPTGKPHVSFSEIKEWAECSWRHKLARVDKIDMFVLSPYLGFGTAVHEGCENMLEGKDLNKEKLLNDIREDFKKHGFDDPEWVEKQPNWYKKSSNVGVEKWCEWAVNMWSEVPDYLDKEFPGWETVKAEEYLYEPIEGKPVKFKGFVDAIIKVPKKRGAGYNYWILDWKTAGAYGWRRDKKQDFKLMAQLILYKHFYSKKYDIELKDIRCAFILLKRGGRIGNIVDIVPVSVGPKTLAKGIKLMNNMISSVMRGFAMKNRNSCQFCPYKDTPHCT
jgi:hypothetical protein